MAWWNFKKEERASVEDPNVPISEPSIMQIMGWSGSISAAGINVTVDNALGVPAVWAAVQFIAGTIAGLPLHVYKKTEDNREKIKGGLATVLHDAPNDETSSFEWRKYTFERVLTGGRGLTYIERNTMGRIVNLWPLDPGSVKIYRRNGRKFYEYTENNKKTTYTAAEIIDIPFMLSSDMLTAKSPILSNKDAIGLAIAATNYGSKFFDHGGVPPFVMTGNFQTGAAMKRASDDLEQTVKSASKEGRLALTLPAGHEIKSIGADPEKSQLTELKRFSIEEIARIYSLPPTFLQDLTHGTFSNTEQQDLHFVKHTVKRWVEQFEQELNLKLFGRQNTSQYVKFNLDGLLRGDFTTRMQGYAQGIQNAVLTPNEARAAEERPSHEKGDDLLVQGATVPLGAQPMNNQTEGNPDE